MGYSEVLAWFDSTVPSVSTDGGRVEGEGGEGWKGEGGEKNLRVDRRINHASRTPCVDTATLVDQPLVGLFLRRIMSARCISSSGSTPLPTTRTPSAYLASFLEYLRVPRWYRVVIKYVQEYFNILHSTTPPLFCRSLHPRCSSSQARTYFTTVRPRPSAVQRQCNGIPYQSPSSPRHSHSSLIPAI